MRGFDACIRVRTQSTAAAVAVVAGRTERRVGSGIAKLMRMRLQDRTADDASAESGSSRAVMSR